MTRDLLAEAVSKEPVSQARVPTLHRLEDLMLRLLVRGGDSEAAAERGIFSGATLSGQPRRYTTAAPDEELDTTVQDSDSMLSVETATRFPRAPPASMASVGQADEEDDRVSRVPVSLRSLTPGGDPSIDESWEMHNLPPLSPGIAERNHHRVMPSDFPTFRRRDPPFEPPQQDWLYRDEQMYEDEAVNRGPPTPERVSEEVATPSPVGAEPHQRTPIHVPPPPRVIQRSPSESSSEDIPQPRRMHPGPLPRPIGLPSPVSMGPPMPPPRPPFRPGFVPTMPMPPTMPRMSLPHLAQNREPMTTTYFRRGVPMAMPGPGMMGPVSPRLTILPLSKLNTLSLSNWDRT
jgi:hypothetical protein